MSNLKGIVVDCAHPASLARFWAAALGYRVRPYDQDEIDRLAARGIDDIEDDPSVAIDPIDGAGHEIFFQRVPEPKATKNRIHFDIYGDASTLEGLGAHVLRRHEEEHGAWTVMADPEGNEFCVVD